MHAIRTRFNLASKTSANFGSSWQGDPRQLCLGIILFDSIRIVRSIGLVVGLMKIIFVQKTYIKIINFPSNSLLTPGAMATAGRECIRYAYVCMR